MSARQRAYDLIQKVYYDSIDVGDMVGAAQAFHEDVDWSHSLVWPHGDEPRRGERKVIHGRQGVADYLSGRKTLLATPRVYHRMGDFIMDGLVGAAHSYVEDENGVIMPFALYFELREDKVAKYAVYPLLSDFLQPGESDAWKQFGRAATY